MCSYYAPEFVRAFGESKMTKRSPVSRHIYTLDQIVNELNLKDSPHLCFTAPNVNGVKVESVVQTSHMLLEDLLKVPGFGETKWRYIRTTSEWIPLFDYVGSEPMSEFLDMEEYLDPYLNFGDEPAIFSVPKGYPREQYYQRVTRRNGDFEYTELVVRHTGERA